MASTVELIAYAAHLRPDSVAFTGPTGPVTFAGLHVQVSATAVALAAQGIDADVAVNAALTPGVAVAAAGDPAKLAENLRAAVALLRQAAVETIGARDLQSLPGILAVVAEKAPDRIALTDLRGGSLTYRELDERSDELAGGLLAAGAGPERLIGVGLERDNDLIVTLLAVVKTGAAYLPLDRSHPIDRLRTIVDDAVPAVVVTDSEMLETWAGLGAPMSTVAGLVAVATPELIARLPEVVNTEHPAYVMYTSGSTGKPKGVVVTHADVVALLRAMGDQYDYRADDVWTMFQSYAFDVSVGEIWVALAFGGRLVVLDYLTTRSPNEFVKVLEREQVSVVNLTPSAFYQLAGAVREPNPGRLSPSVRSMIFVGEALDFVQVRRWFADRRRYDGNDGPQLNNMYGPTEATVYMTRRILTPAFVEATDASDVGTALPGSAMYVLDSRLNRVPEGVPGDLYLAGEQLARGYAGRFELNATRFVADPFGAPGRRMYQSGDVAIVRNGGFEFLGRADGQVKVRGYRIELGEVEAGLLAAVGVNAAAATVKIREGYPDQLVGYIVGAAKDGSPLDVDGVRRIAGTKVPDYMIPDIVMVLDQLPLNVNGKLDRKALPDPIIARSGEYIAPGNDVEQQLAEIVGDVLGLDRVSVTESIFDLGGNSLLAARIVGRACEVLGVDVNMRDIFAEPTVRGLASKVADMGDALPPLSAPNERPDRLPLSLAQERIWFINRFEPDAPTYNIPAVLRVTGDLDLSALRSAVEDVVVRHEVLRTTFPEHDGQPVQFIASASRVAEQLDWRVAADEAEFVAGASTGFDVTQQWPLRVVAWPSKPGEHLVALIAHHIAADGESMLPLVTDLVTAYSARVSGVAPRFAPFDVQFADYALWQREAFGSADDAESVLGRQLGYWRQKLAGLPDVLELPVDRVRPAVASNRGAQVDFLISADVATRVAEVARQFEATPFMVVHAALAVLLARMTATEDIAIATPIAGRGQAAVEPLVGMFVNTLILRAEIDPRARFADLLTQVRNTDLDAFANSDVPFESLVEVLNPVRSEGFSPLAQIMLSFDPASSAANAPVEVAGLTFEPVAPPVVPAQLDLTVTIASAADGQDWAGSLVYATDLFDEERTAALAARFVALLDALTANPDQALGDAALVGPDEASRVLAEGRGPIVDVPPATSIGDAVASQIAATPDAIAVRFEGRDVGYSEFGARVNLLARELLVDGVGPEVAVGVCMDRSVEMMVAVHAVIVAGGQYVPVDVEVPADRLGHMRFLSRMALVLVQQGSVPDVIAAADGLRVVEIDCSVPVPVEVGPLSDADRLRPIHADDAAYTLFTSGSTGLPKGVTVSHRSILNRLWWGLDVFGWSAGDRIVQKTPYTFDVSVPEIFAPLMAGATVVVAAPDGHRDPSYIADLIDQSQATSVHFVPSMLAVFLDVVDADRLTRITSLKWLFASGEALPPATVAHAHRIWPSVEIHNLFGPTEAAVEVGWADVSDAPALVTIGTPVWNTAMQVLDGRLRPVPDGVPGELYLGGVQIARGYSAQPGLTAERFVADPNGAAGARMYRTGDRVRRREGGNIEYLGRTDFQVKLRGQRIELGEIESVLAGGPGVVHAAATVATAAAGGEFLVGYLSPASVNLEAVQAHARQSLPGYMVPSVWAVLDDVVLNSAGKLDRRALPAPDFTAPAAEFVAPEGEAEQSVADVYAELLGRDRVSVTESFFDAGGTSLSAMRLASRAGAVLGVDFSVRDVFDAPTVRELVVRAASTDRVLAPITVTDPRPERIPLSFAQQRMWFINRFDPESPAYNIPLVLRIAGPVDAAALRSAVGDVVTRHEILRTTFPSDDGVAYQRVWPTAEVENRLDWDEVDSIVEVETAVLTGFDVAERWPLRVRLARIGEQEFVLAVVVHHLAADGESLGPLAADLVTAYSARTSGAAPEFAPGTLQFADYAIWQHEVLGSPDDPDSILGRELAFWRERLAGAPDLLALPTDRERPNVATHNGDRLRYQIPGSVTQRISEVARARGVTPFMVLHAAFAVLLARLAATDDVVFGTPIANRNQVGTDRLVGMFVNTLVLRTQVNLGTAFEDLLAQVREADLEAFGNAEVPFETLVEALNPVRSEAFSPVVQVMLSVDPGASLAGAEVEVAGVTFAPIEDLSVPAQMDLLWGVLTGEPGDEWSGEAIFATDLFDASTIEAMADRFVWLLDALTSAPDLAVGDVSLLAAGDVVDCLSRSRGPADLAEPRTLADLFAEQAARHPERTALVFAGRPVPYGEFAARVNSLARELIAAGVGPDTPVGVCMDRSIELLVAINAIIAAGGQYVPIDIDAPAERATYMIGTAGVQTVLVAAGKEAPAALVDRGDRLAFLAVDCSGTVPLAVDPVSDSDRLRPLRVDNAAYTLFTSGSTGRPKGVTISHRAVGNFLRWFNRLNVQEPGQRLLFKTPYTFDASVLELFWPVSFGQTMVIAEPDGHRNPSYLARLMAETETTVVQFVPSLLSVFLDAVPGADAFGSVERVFCGGEALSPAVYAHLMRRAPGVSVTNLFGPTEAAVYTESAELGGELAVVPIGAPMPNTSALVLDSRLHPVPAGVAGELYLGGVQLARGYAARADMTADRFVADPFGEAGTRLYRTGDLVRWNARGELEYLGRTDFQVKLRGQRIELGEIEAVLASVGGVVHAAAAIAEGPGGSEHLVGYVAPDTVDLEAVKTTAAAELPGYMVPTVWMLVTRIALNNAGKIDRRALPTPIFGDTEAEYVAPASAAEGAVAAVFAEILGVERVSVTESFFDLGGNSLSAMRVISRAGQALGVDLSVRDLFAAPTVRALVDLSVDRAPALAPIVAADPRPDRVPLSFAQQRMWFINQFAPGDATYNIPVVMRLSGDLDVEALRLAVVDVVVRHEVLRTVFPAVDGVPFQVVAPVAEVGVLVDWVVVDSRVGFEAGVVAGFDVTVDQPVRVRLWPVGGGEFVLGVVAHHIAADGESMRPLVADLVTAYAARVAGSAPVFVPLVVQFADFAVWQHEVLGSPSDVVSVVGRQLEFWRGQLAGAPEVLELPADRPRPVRASHRGARCDFEISAELGVRVEEVARAHGVTPFMVVHAGLAVLLARLSSTQDVLVATPIAGRGQAVLDPLVGMFVNTLVLRTQVSSGMSFAELLDQVRRVDLDAFAHADAPFETVVEAVDPVRSEAFGPLAQVMLAVTQGSVDAPVVEVGDLRVEPVAAPEVPAQYDLSVNVAMVPGQGWSSSLLYATDLFDEASMAVFAGRLVALFEVLTSDVGSVIGDVDVLTVGERERLALLPMPVVPGSAGWSLPELFAGSVAASGGAVAVSALGRSLSYAELDVRSSAVAAGLVAAGVRPGDLVGLATARSVDVVSSILGVLKAGAAYLPLDVSNPVDRLAFIVGDAGARVVLTDASVAGHELWAVIDASVRVVDVDAVIAENVDLVDGFSVVGVPPASRAYVIYTSGSTGLPKGVEVTHADVAALMAACGEDFDFRSDDVWTLFHSYAFDFSVWELWGPLLSGARVVIVDRDLARDIESFVGVLAAEKVTVLSLTPSAFYQLIDARRRCELDLSLRYLVFGGEELGFDQVRRWFAENPDDGAQLVNMYGITETTVHVSFRPLDRDVVSVVDRSLIGRPLSSLAIHILDDRLHPVAEGVPGEMYVAGGQLAQGYLDRRGLTATRFVADPFVADGSRSRLYRTGDLARWVGGDIEYLGRADGQVQLRGFRIEYGEVEAALLSVGGVSGAAAAIVTDVHRGDLLVGYVVADEGVGLDGAVVRESAGARVPRYMVPDVVMVVDRLPLTGNGKLDRRALPAPVLGDSTAEYIAPEGEVEEKVARVFAEILGVERVSVDASFFDLGGNSLSAMRVVTRVAEALDKQVTVRDIFDGPSVRELIASVAGRPAPLRPLTRQTRPARIPLSDAQRRMWVLNQFDTSSPAYNIPLGVRFRGSLDSAALRQAVLDVIDRHEILRTIYPSDVDGPRQLVLSSERSANLLDWRVVDGRSEFIDAAQQGFDVTSGTPVRVRIRTVVGDEPATEVLIVAHHIAFDGQSAQVFLRDVLAAYTAALTDSPPLWPEMTVQYVDYALWQQTELGDARDPESRLGRQLEWWLAKLDGLPTVTDLPMDRPRPAMFDPAGASLRVPVPEEVARDLKYMATVNRVTPFMVFHAALAVTVARLASTNDVVIGVPIAGRTDPALESLVGMFVNTLVLRTQIDSHMSIAELLAVVRTTDLDAFAQPDVQFERLVEKLAPERSTSHAPLFQIALTHTEGNLDAGPVPLADSGAIVEPIDLETVEAKFDLTVSVHDADELVTEFLYATALFDETAVQRFAQVWQRVLAAMVSDSSQAIGDIVIVENASQPMSGGSARVKVGALPVHATGGSVESGTLIDLLRQRDLDPTHLALIADGEELTYEEFEQRTDRVARSLLRRGVQPEDVVAIAADRSIDSVVATWGVVKSGAAYLPVDPAYPIDRIEYMLEDSAASVGITTVADPAILGDSCDWLDVAQLEAGAPAGPILDGERNGTVRLANLAYLIYTSGSTGRPKAVGVSNAGIADFAAGLASVTGSREDDPDTRILHVASPSFDASVLEMVWAFTAGHTLVIASAEQYAGDALGEVLDRHEVTDMIITPSVLASLNPEFGETVRNLVTGGEACPPDLVERWAARGRRIFNFYGPTETTVWATKSRMLPGKPVTIGRAIDGFTAHVLDGRLHPVPQGVAGELYLSTAGVARGYLGKPSLTSTVFVADPFAAPGTRMYATGDIVRVNSAGNLEFAGRADDQVKINGQRVELGEIESVLADQDGVDQAVVVGVKAESGSARLVGYLVASSGAVDTEAVLTAASSRLAAHMVPAQLVVIDELPLTPGGKLDRAKLPSVEEDVAPEEYVAPVTPDEEVLAAVMAGVLGRDRVSVTESFFALGGDSIMSIQLASAAKAAGLILTPREIFEHRTVRAMAQAAVSGAERSPMLEEPAGGPQGVVPTPPLVRWMTDAAAGNPAGFADFNQSAVLYADSELDAEQLSILIDALVAAHPMLAARLVPSDGEWILTAGTDVAARRAVAEVRSDAIPGGDQFETTLRSAHAEAVARLDPQSGALVQAVLVRGADGTGRVVVAIHHLGVDAVSWPIIIEDLVTGRAQQLTGQPVLLRPEGTSERAWFGALVDRAELFGDELGYWLDRSPQTPTPLATSHIGEPRFADTHVVQNRIESSLAAELLNRVPDAFDGAVTDVLLAALARAIRSWQRDSGIVDDAPVTVLVESYGRYDEILDQGRDPRSADLNRTVGWFTSIAPLALDPANDIVHAVKAAKEERLGQPRHGLGFGLLRQDSSTGLQQRPLPSIAFNYLGGRGTAPDHGADLVSLAPAPESTPLPAFTDGEMRQLGVLALNVSVTPGADGPEIVSDWRYPNAMAADSIAEIVRRWHEELAAVVDEVTAADPGLSPADLPGTGLTQNDLDVLAQRYPDAELWPLAPLQRGLYFQAKFAGGSGVDVYVTQAVLHLGADTDLARLHEAVARLAGHHRTLRSAFVQAPSGAVVTVVPESVTVPWDVLDLRSESVEDAEAALARIVDEQKVLPFDLAAPPLLRLVVVQRPNGVSVVISNHHILFDGWSGPLVLADLLAEYATGSSYTEQVGAGDKDFRDFLQLLSARPVAEGLEVWARALDAVDGPTLIAAGAQASREAMPRKLTTTLDASTTSALEARARESGATVATVLQAAWAVFLSRITGQEGVVFGETVSGRPADLEGVESMVGLFINTLPVVVDVSASRSLSDMVSRLQSQKVALLDYQHLGMPEILAYSGHGDLFDTLTIHESYPVNTDSLSSAVESSGADLVVEGVDVADATHYPLNFFTAPTADGLVFALKYLPSAFDDAQVASFAQMLTRIIETFAWHPETQVQDVALLSPAAEADEAVLEWGELEQLPAVVSVSDAVAAQVSRTPVATALVFGDREVSYGEFGARVSALARVLIAAGVGLESAVA
ncbi:MAG: amino acid adenylation domain-containing protein, partial [Gordonia sp. (in: high G+C Gram-positive bacteria)]|uniref:non-ribosomal peptide synthetase n=1 Tax=Gordonia sp. (in: high G+C Gram-positive bacteria) TaxID=84139 RepID=UPI003BB76A5C